MPKTSVSTVAVLVWKSVFFTHFLHFRLTGILCVIRAGSTVQIVIAVCFMLFFIKLYSNYSPYAENSISSLKSFTQWQIYAVYFIALLIKVEAFSSKSNDTLLQFLLVLATLANLLVELLQHIGVCLLSESTPSVCEKELSDSVTSNPLREDAVMDDGDADEEAADSDLPKGIRMSVIAKYSEADTVKNF